MNKKVALVLGSGGARGYAHIGVIEALEGCGGLKVVRPQATYLAWIDCRAAGIEHPQRFFEEAGVGLSDGADFGLPGFVRLNFGCPRSLLEQALERMRQALHNPA